MKRSVIALTATCLLLVSAYSGAQEGRFVVQEEGTITETTAGVMWQRGEPEKMGWKEATAYCAALELAGFTDWRLAQRKELFGLVTKEKKKPRIDTEAFPDAQPEKYWTGAERTPQSPEDELVWGGYYVDFKKGKEHYAPYHKKYRFRCVRKLTD